MGRCRERTRRFVATVIILLAGVAPARGGDRPATPGTSRFTPEQMRRIRGASPSDPGASLPEMPRRRQGQERLPRGQSRGHPEGRRPGPGHRCRASRPEPAIAGNPLRGPGDAARRQAPCGRAGDVGAMGAPMDSPGVHRPVRPNPSRRTPRPVRLPPPPSTTRGGSGCTGPSCDRRYRRLPIADGSGTRSTPSSSAGLRPSG